MRTSLFPTRCRGERLDRRDEACETLRLSDDSPRVLREAQGYCVSRLDVAAIGGQGGRMLVGVFYQPDCCEPPGWFQFGWRDGFSCGIS